MKYKFFLIIIIFNIALFSVSASAQDCQNFSQSYCTLPFDWDYELNSQSVNIPMFEGQSFKFSAIFYEGFDYYIGFCVDKELGSIQYRILSSDIYLDKKISISVNDDIEHIEFENQNTRVIVIEVKVLRQSSSIDINNRKCVGIIIGQKKTESEF